MANEAFIDPVTVNKPRKSFRRLLIAGLVASVIFIAGLIYVLSQAYVVYRVPYRAAVTSSGFTVGSAQIVPRGANYIRLAKSPTGVTYHSTFEPGQYSTAAAQNALTGMKNGGYNTVRVFIDQGEFTAPSHGISTGVDSAVPIRPEYIANVADFIKLAEARGIYTIPVLDGIPANTYYYKLAGSPTEAIQGNNVLYLDNRYVQAKELYMKEFITALHGRLTAQERSKILAYQPDNEVFFDASKPPLNVASGTLTSLDGVPYNMAVPDRRQQALDANLVVYSTRLKQAIRSVDPLALMTLGFFTNNAVGKTAFNGSATYCSTNCRTDVNYWVPGRPAPVSIYGSVDFIDLHVYSSGPAYNLKNDLASSEYQLLKKPYILGEMGTPKNAYKNNVTAAANGMKALQTTSCTLNAKGWLFWTWDTSLTTTLAGQDTFYSLADNNGAINGQLAPAVRPNPCK